MHIPFSKFCHLQKILSSFFPLMPFFLLLLFQPIFNIIIIIITIFLNYWQSHGILLRRDLICFRHSSSLVNELTDALLKLFDPIPHLIDMANYILTHTLKSILHLTQHILYKLSQLICIGQIIIICVWTRWIVSTILLICRIIEIGVSLHLFLIIIQIVI